MAAYREPAAGELNRRLAIRRRIDLPANDMGLDPLFSVLKGRWGKIQPVGTAVYAEGVQTDAKVTHRIWFRILKGITDAHEVVHVAKVPGAEDVYEVVPDTPLYRVKRSADMNGTRRFTLLEVEELSPSQSGTGIYV
ncbi:Bacteriophage head-tail adaptor [Pseudomonas fluorescens]|uniref:Bacteriophage head-tail adaptor n=1 Tax=Pseudomonas fluorescens TaxID=294 RepID=A0A3S4PQR8_PSEFL|nr:head-tail adaptor protein [Pseudomonas fluorescens]VEF08408.1 Bacteriophage head-tail adaptor [Pseudomonas fluorescens]